MLPCVLPVLAAALQSPLTRRAVMGSAVAASLSPPAAFADFSSGRTGADDYLQELPPKAKQAYLQYLPQLQLDGDFYVFVLQPLLTQPGKWDRIADLVLSTDIGSAASVSRLDREFVTPMRILSLAFPPDLGGDEMQESIDKFQSAMFSLARQARKSGTTGNVSGPSEKELKDVAKTWDTGRVALNEFFAAVNAGTQSDRLAPIPPNGQGYPRSERLYTQLMKDAALCRNRGGEALAGLWGQLMVYGTVPGVNPCGNAAAEYYAQGMK